MMPTHHDGSGRAWAIAIVFSLIVSVWLTVMWMRLDSIERVQRDADPKKLRDEMEWVKAWIRKNKG
jgi:hypothetical protein